MSVDPNEQRYAFLGESHETLEQLDQHLTVLERDPTQTDRLDALREGFVRLQQACESHGFAQLAGVTGAAAVHLVSLGKIDLLGPEVGALLLAVADAVRTTLTAIEHTGGEADLTWDSLRAELGESAPAAAAMPAPAPVTAAPAVLTPVPAAPVVTPAPTPATVTASPTPVPELEDATEEAPRTPVVAAPVAQAAQEAPSPKAERAKPKKKAEPRHQLVVTVPGGTRLALSTKGILRVEHVPLSKVESSGERRATHYRGGPLPLLAPADLFPERRWSSLSSTPSFLAVVVHQFDDTRFGLIVEDFVEVLPDAQTDSSLERLDVEAAVRQVPSEWFALT